MAGRHTLDFRLWTPWSDRARATFERTSQTAWANPLHPASEGRRAAVWLDAMAATVERSLNRVNDRIDAATRKEDVD